MTGALCILYGPDWTFCRVDSRLPALALVLKQWAVNVGVVDAQNGKINRWVDCFRLDSQTLHSYSYSLLLMIINYLQCAVHPPVLPNLFKLFPDRFDESRAKYTELVDTEFVAKDIPGECLFVN
jgi:hypothetical protein